MPQELNCPDHGPYDASYGTCPYCSGDAKRPGPPPSLYGDEMPTQIGGGGRSGYDEAPTEIGGGKGGFGEDPTEIGRAKRGGGAFDDDDPTELGKGGRREDFTELDFDLVEAGMMAILWVKKGRRRGHIYKIQDGAVVGREDGDVIMDDPKVSNPHARFRLNEKEDGFILWDFGSKNGSYVNDERITSATELKENDVVKIGDTEMVIKILL